MRLQHPWRRPAATLRRSPARRRSRVLQSPPRRQGSLWSTTRDTGNTLRALRRSTLRLPSACGPREASLSAPAPERECHREAGKEQCCQPTHVLQLSVRLHHQLLRSGSCVTSWRSAHVSGTEEKDVGLTGQRQSSAQETKLATARAGHPCVYRASRSSVPAFVRRHPATPGPGAAAAVTAAGPRGHLCASAEAWRPRKRRIRASRRQMSAPSIPVHNAPGGGGARDV